MSFWNVGRRHFGGRHFDKLVRKRQFVKLVRRRHFYKLVGSRHFEPYVPHERLEKGRK
jgi:hypothetical protein